METPSSTTYGVSDGWIGIVDITISRHDTNRMAKQDQKLTFASNHNTWSELEFIKSELFQPARNSFWYDILTSEFGGQHNLFPNTGVNLKVQSKDSRQIEIQPETSTDKIKMATVI